jgi:integrase
VAHWGIIWEREGEGGKRRFVLDFGRYGKIYSHKGVRLESREQAQALLDTIRILGQEISKQHAVDRFAPMASKRHRIGPWLERWLADFEQQVKAGERARRTLREYTRWARPHGHFEFWRNRSMHAVGPLASRDYLAWLRVRNVSGKTAWNVVAGFHAFLGWLVEVEQLAAVPKVTWPKKPRSNPATIGPATQRAILDAIPEESRGVFLAMALLCIRPSEAVEMTSRQLRGDGWITIDVSRADRGLYSGTKGVKNEEPKTLPLPDELAEWIERWVPRERRVAGAGLFVNPNTGGPWAETSLKRAWYKACAQVGVRVSLYTGTKHSTATELRRQGVPLDVIQKLCGHRDPRSTEVYAKLADQALVEAIRRPRAGSKLRSRSLR